MRGPAQENDSLVYRISFSEFSLISTASCCIKQDLSAMYLRHTEFEFLFMLRMSS